MQDATGPALLRERLSLEMELKRVRSVVLSFMAGLLMMTAGALAAAAPREARAVLAIEAHHTPMESAGPPILLAQVSMRAPAVGAAQPLPAIVAQTQAMRMVTPHGSQPGVVWLIAMGMILCRFGARILRVS